jgi:endogenous inhibitor of DNA gyrase (YacG/DUF329 family)
MMKNTCDIKNDFVSLKSDRLGSCPTDKGNPFSLPASFERDNINGELMKKGVYITCPICGKIFYIMRSGMGYRKYCSRACHAKAQENKYVGTCKICGKTYNRPKSQVKWRGSNYCSTECQNIGASQKKGEHSTNWKGGTSDIKRRIRASCEWRSWRKKVFERDNYTCQICGARNSKDSNVIIKLHPHHIKSFAEYPELRFDVNNGQTLCSLCHYKLHGNLNKGHVRILKYKLTPKICPGCGGLFLAKSDRHYICSHKCQSRLDRKKKRDAKAR